MATRPTKLLLSAIVTTHNEGHLLARCLESIAFCDELIVVDLESDDDSAEVARRHGARVVSHPLVPIAEAARVDVATQARHDWILVVDPDETVPAPLVAEVRRTLETMGEDVAAIDAPRQYYFAGRALRGTVWGGDNWRRLLVRRAAVELTPTIWGGMRVKPGFRVGRIPFTPQTAIEHQWVTGYRDLVTRHLRYLKLEPGDREAAGETTSFRAVGAMPWRSFEESFIRKRGYLDGARGLGLSLFWAAFRTAGEAALLLRIRRGSR